MSARVEQDYLPVRRGPILTAAVGIDTLITGSDGKIGLGWVKRIAGVLLEKAPISKEDDYRFDAILTDPKEFNRVKYFGPLVLKVVKADSKYTDDYIGLNHSFSEHGKQRSFLNMYVDDINLKDPNEFKKQLIKVGEFISLFKDKLPQSSLVGITSSVREALVSEELWPKSFFSKDTIATYKKSSGEQICFRTFDQFIKFFEANQPKKV